MSVNVDFAVVSARVSIVLDARWYHVRVDGKPLLTPGGKSRRFETRDRAELAAAQELIRRGLFR